MKILETKKFKKLLKYIIKSSSITKERYQELKNIVKKDIYSNHIIRPHKIKCGKDEIISLSIPNTQYRILCYLTCNPKIAIFGWIGTHREYEIILKNKKNCKNYLFKCEELEKLITD
ncbi:MULTISPECIES: hypothetical protein [unclassified Lebetimonas]|uniref:hypothetical protein n=1 Tax=unclassified Lebetimonas TaxID=2648158 RepID=UPI000467A003|nr:MULTISPECIES: hypothetical protein [unclassified Lebetimonas]